MASKKPAITGVARPQGWIDDTIKAIGKRMSKPAEITVNVGRKSSSIKKVTVQPKRGAGVAGPTPPKGRPTVKIDSKPKIYNEKYTKGTQDYKDALKGQRRSARALKKVNKYSDARATRSMEYNEARAFEKYNKYVAGTRGQAKTSNASKEKVRQFIEESPRKVKSGKRPAVKQPKPDKSITRKGPKK